MPEANARQTIDALMAAAGFGSNQQTLNKRFVEQILLPLPPIAEQARIIAEVDRHLSIVREVEVEVEGEGEGEGEVDTNLKRAQVPRQAAFSKAFFSQSTVRVGCYETQTARP